MRDTDPNGRMRIWAAMALDHCPHPRRSSTLDQQNRAVRVVVDLLGDFHPWYQHVVSA